MLSRLLEAVATAFWMQTAVNQAPFEAVCIQNAGT